MTDSFPALIGAHHPGPGTSTRPCRDRCSRRCRSFRSVSPSTLKDVGLSSSCCRASSSWRSTRSCRTRSSDSSFTSCQVCVNYVTISLMTYWVILRSFTQVSQSTPLIFTRTLRKWRNVVALVGSVQCKSYNGRFTSKQVSLRSFANISSSQSPKHSVDFRLNYPN